MFWRRRAIRPPPDPPVPRGLDTARRLVEEAKASLVSAAPRGRPSSVPLAEALAGFEEGLRRSRALIDAGGREDEPSQLLVDAVDESLRRAARFRLEADPRGYGELIEEIDRLLEPLEAFEEDKAEGAPRRPT